MTSEWPHGILGRQVVLRPGSEAYAQDVARCALDAQLWDTPWTRWQYGAFMASAPEDVLLANGPHYRFRPSSSLERRARELWARRHPEVIPMLWKSPEGRAAVQEWRSTKFLADRHQALAALPLILRLGANEFRSAIADLKPTASERGEFLEGVPMDELGSALLEFIEADAATNRSALRDFRAAFPQLLNEKQTALKATDLVLQHMDAVSVDDLPFLLGIVDCDVADTRHGNSCGPQVVIPVKTEGLMDNAVKLSAANTDVAAQVFHAMAHMFPSKAAEIAAGRCQGTDSTLTKAIVVLASRHELQPGCLDRAFSGDAPRTTWFRSFGEYLSGSRAADTYAALAGHGLDQVGKRWPPYFGARRATEDDPAQWARFVDTYKWFPAVDDAYYRWAYALLLQNRLEEAVQVVERFKQAQLPDDDSAPYLEHLALVARSELGEPIPASALLNSSNHLYGYTDTPQLKNLDRRVALADFLLRHLPEISGLSATQEQLIQARLALDVRRADCAKSQGENCALPFEASLLDKLDLSVPASTAASATALMTPVVEDERR